MAINFIHLNLHTEYSIVDGIIKIDELFTKCNKIGMPAIALTDQSNLFAAVKFYEAAIFQGVKPIFGVDLLLRDDCSDDDLLFRLTVLAKNFIGYKNLLKLITKSYIEVHSSGRPIVRRDWIEELSEGLIVLSGAKDGDVGRFLLENNFDQAKAMIKFWQRSFSDNYYLEISRTNRKDEELYLSRVFDLAIEFKLPMVATNAVRFLDKDDFVAHDARVCINSGYVLYDNNRPNLYSEEQYLKSSKEMEKLFKDIPESLFNSVEIAKRCNVELKLGKTFLPIFPINEEVSEAVYFAEKSREGLAKKFNGTNNLEEYKDRLEYEISVINQMGFAGYFLIVADFINWSKNHDIPVGPGRGSGAGSLVAYALGITDVDPLKHELLFERFLNPERVSLPDFDVDFCMDGRDRVIDYVIDRYGKDKVAQIITYGTMAARAVVRDVGRVLGYPYGYTDKIAKLIPFALGMTLTQALKEEELLVQRYKQEEEVRVLIDLAKKLEGIVRNAGTHAGGVVIAPSALIDFMPLYRESDDSGIISQFDKDDIEKIGLVKFDFLGLRTLTIISWAVKSINQKLSLQGKKTIDINELPLDDRETYELLQSGKTTAVFQLESRISHDLLRRFRPDRFDDIIALIAIIRPGVLQSGMIDEIIGRKHAKTKVSYLHPKLEPILKSTYGVAIYQEQVMQIAQSLAGYSLGSADLLRRAMGKKKPEEMVKQRAVFIDGAVKNAIDERIAKNIFDLMEKFASYGFNKSHSAAYALISYQTAWLKTHHCAEFMAAVLSSDMDNTDKVVLLLNECKNFGLKIVDPDINRSSYNFVVSDSNPDEILYGLSAIKGVGVMAARAIVEERYVHGGYRNLFDLCLRVEANRINKRVLEALICAGALDSIGPNRASQMASVEEALKISVQCSQQKISKQLDLFSEFSSVGEIEYVPVGDWPLEKRLKMEKEVLGFYLREHPIERFSNEIYRLVKSNIAGLESTIGEIVRVAGFISATKIINTKSGNRVAILTLEDGSGFIDITLFDELFASSRMLLSEDRLIIVEGELVIDSFSNGYRIKGQKILDLPRARELYAKGILLTLGKTSVIEDSFYQKFHQILSTYNGGKCPVFVDCIIDDRKIRLVLGDEWKVFPSDELIDEMTKQFSNIILDIVY